MQKERKTVKRDKIIILKPLNKWRIFGSSSRTMDNILTLVLWAVLQILKPLPGGRRSRLCCSQACGPQTSWNQKVDDADSRWPHHQPVRRISMSWSHPRSLNTIKIPHYPLQGGTHSSEGTSPLWPPLPGKAIKLFFSTSSKTLSRCFCSALVNRGGVSATEAERNRSGACRGIGSASSRQEWS